MRSNPFAVRFCAPGNLPWISHEAVDSESELAGLQQRFQSQLDSRAILLGAHGTGKSTLLEHLVPRLGTVCYRRGDDGQVNCLDAADESSRVDVKIVWLVLRRQSRMLSLCPDKWRPGGLLVLDGFEQLSWPARQWTVAALRMRGMGLLATSHRPVSPPMRLPILAQTSVSPERLLQVVEMAWQQAGCSGSAESFVRRDHARELLQHKRGNARECLMQLYDEFQQEYSAGSRPARQSHIPTNMMK